DRFFDSTTAYQGYGRKLPLSDVERCNNIATRGLTPDMTFLFNISLGESKKRTLHKNPDRIENSGDGFFERVICGFIEISKHYEDRFVIVDAVRSIDEVHEIIVNNIIKKFD
ncbi:MAG: dTMP kinase, partial [Bacteroidota bacterium]|nr:dTMP kinase [Bacteroidota bacterium]